MPNFLFFDPPPCPAGLRVRAGGECVPALSREGRHQEAPGDGDGLRHADEEEGGFLRCIVARTEIWFQDDFLKLPSRSVSEEVFVYMAVPDVIE